MHWPAWSGPGRTEQRLVTRAEIVLAAADGERARYAGLVRHRADDDPELATARQSMQEQVLLNAIDKALSDAPPLTPEMRSRIVGLLADHTPAAERQEVQKWRESSRRALAC